MTRRRMALRRKRRIDAKDWIGSLPFRGLPDTHVIVIKPGACTWGIGMGWLNPNPHPNPKRCVLDKARAFNPMNT